MTTSYRSENETSRRHSTPVLLGIGWVASLLGYVAGRALITALGPAAGWFNILLVIIPPVLAALAGTVILPARWVRGAQGVWRHTLVVVPVPVVFLAIAMVQRPADLVPIQVVLIMVVVVIIGTLVGALLGRLLRRDPDRAFRGSY